MSMVKVENLTFSYPSGSENIFEDVSFQFDTDWKLGICRKKRQGKNNLFEAFAKPIFSSWLTNFKRQQDFETAKTQKLKKDRLALRGKTAAERAAF